MYYVVGGVWDSTEWNYVTHGTQEVYGPFDDYAQALEMWKRGTFSPKLDICTHRLFIKQEA